MFGHASAFNQPIGEWNVSNVTTMDRMFLGASKFNQPIGEWNVSKVTNMEWMFSFASAFNQPIGEWNVSNVTNMGRMFYYAEKFNQPIGEWNVSNVTTMYSMFDGAYSFDQPIGEWNVSNVTNMKSMFYNSGYTKEQPNVERSKQRNRQKDLHHLTQVFKNNQKLYTPGPSELIAKFLGATKDEAKKSYNTSNKRQQPGGKRKTRKMRKSKKV
jgi:surface protein